MLRRETVQQKQGVKAPFEYLSYSLKHCLAPTLATAARTVFIATHQYDSVFVGHSGVRTDNDWSRCTCCE